MSWVARVPRAHESRLLGLRAFDVELASDDHYVWVRGQDASAALDLALRCTDALERFDVAGDDRLVRPGERVPCARLPDLTWVHVRSALWPTPSTSPIPSRPAQVPLRLVRSHDEEPATALLVSFDEWIAWCANAPQVRLERLSFAASSDGRVYVRGSPLPPLVGSAHVERDGVATPAGWTFDPPIARARIASRLELGAGDVALFQTDGWQRIPAAGFVRATRSAARATHERALAADSGRRDE